MDRDGIVDWAGTDGTIKDEDLPNFKGGDVLYFPTVVAPITVSYDLDIDGLKLSPTTIAKIFQREITVWNDPAIAALNPGVTLPSAKITVVHRSDGSGTTFNFVNYLSKVSPEWKTKVGEGTAVQWPVGLGGKGNEGVSAFVQRIPGSIGYVEYAYVKQNKLTYTALVNKAGKTVQPTVA